MLTEILRYIRNYFSQPAKAAEGNFKIEGGTIGLNNVIQGQYFLIEGSALNDGVYLYPATGLKNEEFSGRITPLAIPAELVALAEEIAAYNQNNKAGAFVSESFGGYSYTRATNSSGAVASWQEAFNTRLNAWRKV